MEEVLIVGGGPIGLFLALQLIRLGHRILLVEKDGEKKPGSNAIGIMPPSLFFFEQLSLKDELLRYGSKIQHVSVYADDCRFLGRVDFSRLLGPFPYIFSVPQGITERVLNQALDGESLMERLDGTSFVSLTQDSSYVVVTLKNAQGRSFNRKVSFCVGCDGAQSSVRDFLIKESPYLKGIRLRHYKPTFVMGDFLDRTGWKDEVRLFFTSKGAVESIPIGQGSRRWIVQTPSFFVDPQGYLEEAVNVRALTSLDQKDCLWMSSFGMQRFLMPRWHFGRVFLAGDSAHIMSPIGGQGMNTGFADAYHLAFLLHLQLRKNMVLSQESALYSYERRRAALSAIRRAEFSMAIGTVQGKWSFLRDVFLRFLLTGFLKDFIPPHYAMMTIPQARKYA